MSNVQLLAHEKAYIEAFKLYRRVFKGANDFDFQLYAVQNGGLDNLPKVSSSLLLLAALK